ncbi:MAG: DUF1080 domain-containing protein [Phycisphaerales bacterium]|nr:MAG: DUF1080 domain-containing protein [Phycisphaerales bacterium]
MAVTQIHGCANRPQPEVQSPPPQTASSSNELSPIRGTIALFDGTGFSHWIGADGGPVEWEIVDGAMQVAPGTGSIITTEPFRDFLLHVEFNIPQSPPDARGQGRGNSGVYIQRRYEVQILDSFGLEAGPGDCAALYRFKAPDENACRKPGEWQTYDITFRSPRWEGQGENARKIENARITVIHNGVLIHDEVELQNKTGAGRTEGPEPGPILLQDHGHKVRFRNIWIVPLD